MPETCNPASWPPIWKLHVPSATLFAFPLATRIEWSQALPATALAGLIAAVLMMTPGGFGLGMLIGGSLSVVFYRRRNPVANITPGMGSRLGMASGVLGGCIFTCCFAPARIVFHAWDRIRQKIIELVEQTAARNPDPQAQQAMELFKTRARHQPPRDLSFSRDAGGFRDFLRPRRRSQRYPAAPKGTQYSERRTSIRT